MGHRKLPLTLTVDQIEGSLRIDSWLALQLPEISRNKIKQLIKKGAIIINGHLAAPKTAIKIGDQIQISFIPAESSTPHPVNLNLTVIFEDKDLMVINKPAGLTVHPGAGTGDEITLVHGLLHHTGGNLGKPKDSDPTIAAERAGIVHRLDKDTSGILVCAKNDETYAALTQQFAKKTAKRTYIALLDGCLNETSLSVENYLTRDRNHRTRFVAVALKDAPQPLPVHFRWACSHFLRKAEYSHCLTLAQVILDTGRTHQIRVHAKAIGKPIVGDPIYGKIRTIPQVFDQTTRTLIAKASRQMLHGQQLEFIHPRSSQPLCFKASLPDDFSQLIDALQPYRRPQDAIPASEHQFKGEYS